MKCYLSFDVCVDATQHPIDVVMELADILHSYAMQNRCKWKQRYLPLLREASALIDAEGPNVSPDFKALDAMIDELTDALNDFAPPFTAFVREPERIGLKVLWTMLREAALEVEDLEDVPRSYRGYVLVINDHGNATLYHRSARRLRELWAAV